MRNGLRIRPLIAGAALIALTACASERSTPEVTPQARPAGLGVPPPQIVRTPSAKSQALSRKYSRLQAHLLAQGLLRTDGGGPDTYYSAADLQRNFEQIAFYDEYAAGGGIRRAARTPGLLRKWTGPVRMNVAFGTNVPTEQRAGDADMVARFASRLARVTGHPIAMSNDRPNFTVFFMTADDGGEAQALLRSIYPNVSSANLSLIGNLPRQIYCVVMAFGSASSNASYVRAVAFVRAEHPELIRRACVQEEVAQGLGLANDSPRARPSIFNDDDEFAYLTTHDEELLRLLYNPALRPGMTLDEARPILRGLIAARSGPS